MLRRRGVSPVVATVILIVIVIIIAIIIFLWAKAFLSEAARKGDRAVEISCGEVEFEYQIVRNVCGPGGNTYAALDINNVGNVPIYGLRVLEWNDAVGEVITEEVFPQGTITIGKSESICLNKDVDIGNSFRVVPKLLAEDSDGKKIVYTCPEKDGITISYTGG